ncbi:hypothetical protein LIER_20606 [Lithospermum erythrorhizon]|uniref:Retrovirus-related Pol polyprotein from transposon TNT 1-94-like beta-barrel domain-containing protein n=1 Tax=Lithospermum erythrorhizon TaxID=34254 RepID=A0AAV3QM25_LITER
MPITSSLSNSPTPIIVIGPPKWNRSSWSTSIWLQTIPLAVGKQSSHAIWIALKTALANASFSSQMCLQAQLIGLKQDNLSIAAYLKHAKVAYDVLAAIGKEPPQDVFLIYILRGLREEYKDLKFSMFSRGSNWAPPNSTTVCKFRFQRSRTVCSRSRPFVPGPIYSTGRANHHDKRQSPQPSWHSSDQHKSRCFICEFILHLANNCPHRSAPLQAHYIAPFTQPSSPKSSAYTHANATSYVPWVPDTGTSDHISPDMVAFHQPELYLGNDRLHVANGQQLNITHTGTIPLSGTTRPLLLNDVLHVLSSQKSLLFVQKNCKDNAAFFEFQPSYFVIRDQVTRRPLISRTSRNGLYQFPSG